MSRRSRALRKQNRKEADEWDLLLGAPLSAPPGKAKRGPGKVPMEKWKQYTIWTSVVIAAGIVIGKQTLWEEPPAEDWSITDQSNGDPAIPNRKVAPKDPNAPARLRLEVGQKASIIVCKGLTFVDETRGVEIHDPVVDGLASDRNGAMYPRSVTVADNNGSIDIGPANKPTDYKWILGTGKEVMTVPSRDCAEHQVRADQFSNGPHKSDTLRLRDPGYEAYVNQPVTDFREGLVHFEEPYRP